MFTILYLLPQILAAVVLTLLGIGLLRVIEREVIGPMQRRIGPNVIGYTALALQRLFAVPLMIVVLILGFTALTLFYNVWLDPIYCKETEAVATIAKNTGTSPQGDVFNSRLLNATWATLNLYCTYKIFQLKSGLPAKISALGFVFGTSTGAVTAMHDVTNPDGFIHE